MSDKELKVFLEEMLAGKPLNYDPGCLQTLTPGLQACVNEIKNLLKRINR